MKDKDKKGKEFTMFENTDNLSRDTGFVNFIKGYVVDVVRSWYNDRAEYHDSAIVWDPDQMDFVIIRCGTDFWDGVSIEYVRASDTIMKFYAEFKQGKYSIFVRKEREQLAAKLAKIGIKRPDQIDYFSTLPSDRRDSILKLITSNLRSEFRMSLRDQFTAWISAHPKDRKYPDPFSPRQWGCLSPVPYTRRWR